MSERERFEPKGLVGSCILCLALVLGPVSLLALVL